MKIPNLNLNEKNEIQEETKEIPIKINKEDQVVVIKKLSTGERNKIQSKCTDIKIIGGQPNVKVNAEEVQEITLSATIVSAPFDTSIEGIKKLPAEVSDYLYHEFREFAEPTDKKKD